MDVIALVKQAQSGDAQSFGLLYDAFAEKIFRYIKVKIQHTPEAEDTLQEVFIKAWGALPKFKAEDGNFSAWLYRIATNLINDHFRRVYRHPETVELHDELDLVSSQNVEASLQSSMDTKVLRDCLDQLQANYKEVLELRYVQDFTLEETARILGKSNVSIRVLQFRALQKLKEIMNQRNV